MTKLSDYSCTYGNDGTAFFETANQLGLGFPEAYVKAGDMAMLAKALRQDSSSKFCYLPFCHTVEAAALGADINLGNEYAGPRARSYIFNSLDELSDLPEFDFSKGRISQVLDACRMLHAEGESVALEVCGPLTVLSALIDIGQIIKGWRNKPEYMIEIFNGIGRQLIRYMNEAAMAGVRLICYADPTGGLNITGPKLAEIVATNFTVPFLHECEMTLGGNALIHLCPKTSLIITGLGLAEWHDIELDGVLSYEEACLEILGKTGMVGAICIQDAAKRLEDCKIRSLTVLCRK